MSGARKAYPLRVDPALWAAIERCAAADLRSVNAQVECLLREAMKLANGHLDYIDYLIDHRAWVAGSTMSMADLAAAAQISVADYLGGVDWTGHEQTKAWYAMFKSRPSFRPLLSERMEVITPPKHYEQVDF